MLKEVTPREQILSRIRNALLGSKPEGVNLDLKAEVYDKGTEFLEIEFAKAFGDQMGHFFYCADEAEFLHLLYEYVENQKLGSLACSDQDLSDFLVEGNLQITSDFENARAGITTSEALIARTGSIIVSNARQPLLISSWPEHLIVLAFASRVLPDLRALTDEFQKRPVAGIPSLFSILTPSILHDPLEHSTHRKLAVFMIDDLSAESEGNE
jgi:L-lactate dehydrogenase complex protein LldG